MKNFVNEFRDFTSTASMIELAVAVILAGAIGRVIAAFTDGVMMNIVAAIFGKPDFDSVRIKLRSGSGGDLDTYMEIGSAWR